MWTIAYYETLRQLRLRPVQLILFLMPLVVIFILGSALSGMFHSSSAKVTKLRLAYGQEVVAGSSGERLLSGLDANLVKVEKFSSNEAVLAALRKGIVDIVVQFDENKPPQLLLGRSIENNVAGQLAVDTLLMKAEGQKLVSSNAVTIENPIESYSKVTGLQFFSAAMLVMFLLYGGMSAAISLVENRKNGTQERLFAQPLKPGKIIGGLLLGSGLVAACQALAIIAGTALLFGVNWGNQPFVLALVCMLTITCCMGMAAIAARFVRSRRTIQLIFQYLTVVMTLVSGGYNPMLANLFGRMQLFTINHWAVKSMLNVMQHGTVQESMLALVPVAAVAAVLAVIVWMSYTRVGSHE